MPVLARTTAPNHLPALCTCPPCLCSFYDGAAKLGMMEAFKKLAVGPDALPDIIFASVGRTIWKDVGGVALGFRLLEKLVDLNALFTLAAPIMHRMPDFQQQLALLRDTRR